MSAASLSLLKGGKKSVETELAAPEEAKAAQEGTATEASGDEDTVVDVDTMSSAELDQLCKDQGVETPDNWSKMKVGEKRAWLKSQFEEVPSEGGDAGEPGAAATDAEQTETKAEAPEQPAEAGSEAPAAAEEAAPADKTKGKGKGKGKSVAVSTAKNGEVVGPDMLSDLVHEIENMKEKQARDLVSQLTEHTEVTSFKLGGVLSLIQANGWYTPYASFREFVEKEHGMHYRKATYWIDIYNKIVESKVPWDKVKDVGWTKLKEIAGVLTPENVDEWVKLAASQNTITLIETVKNHKLKDAPKSIEDQTSKTVTTKTFKVHEDQKATIEGAIAKAKEESGTVHDTVALEHICMDYMGGQTIQQKLMKMGIEAACELLEKAFPSATINVELGDDGETQSS